MRTQYVFTSESVTEGHPDKLCDQISDAIVDHFLQQDPLSRVTTECAVTTGIVFIATHFASRASVDVPDIARSILRQAGYNNEGAKAEDTTVLARVAEFPNTDYHPVDERELSDDQLNRVTAKDQVTVFGYACRHTAAFLPLPIWLAHRLVRRLSAVRLAGTLPFLGPDGKSQVGVEFHNRIPRRIHSLTLLASQQERQQPPPNQMNEALLEQVIKPVFQEEAIGLDEATRIFINPNGPFTGGPAAHAGLTGRKTAVDTYGEYCRHSGAALSGKDPLRIDRVGAYAARLAAKNVVAAGLAEECEVQLSYTIGIAAPVTVNVETFGSGRISDDDIAGRLSRVFDFRLGAIVRDFQLRFLPSQIKGGFYRKLAAYGHVGRMDIGLPWEATDRAPQLIEGQ